MKLVTVTAALLLSTIVVANAESLEEKKFWKGQRNYVDRELQIADKACGTTFSFEWIDPPTLRAEAEKSQASPMGICTNIIKEVASVCREGKDEADTVKAKINGFQCGHSASRTLDMKGGKVIYMGNNKQANFSNWAKPWLMKHL